MIPTKCAGGGPHSRTEAQLVYRLMRRGRASYEMLDAALAEAGASINTRSLVLLHIRKKIWRLGERCPFERIAQRGIWVTIEPDERGSTTTVIGLKQDLEFIRP